MVTPIGFGVLTVGNTQLNLPVEEGAEVLRYALERGINFLDTAQYYETYPYIREALKDTDFYAWQSHILCGFHLSLTANPLRWVCPFLSEAQGG